MMDDALSTRIDEMGRRFPALLRGALVAAGAFCIVMPVRELGPYLWPPSILGIIASVIMLGALALGLCVLTASVRSQDEDWHAAPRAIHVRHRLWGRERWTILHGTDVARVAARHETSADSDDVWFVELHRVAGGPPIVSRSFRSADRARRAADDLEVHLWGSPVPESGTP